jgi:hypothetical protein
VVTPSKRVRTDDFPVVALAEFVAFIVVDRAGTIREFLDVPTGGGRVEDSLMRVSPSIHAA